MEYNLQEKSIYNKSHIFFGNISEFTKDNLYYIHAIGHYYASPNYDVHRPPNQLFDSLLIIVIAGALHIKTGNTDSVASIGDFIIFNTQTEHHYFVEPNTGDCEFIFMHFAGANSKTLVTSLTATSHIISNFAKRDVLLEIIFELYALFSSSTTDVEESVVSIKIHHILAVFSQQYNASYKQTYSKYVNFALSTFTQFNSAINIDKIAENLSISKQYFINIFKREIGISPYAFLLNIRLNKGKHLLHKTNLSIEEITTAIGYSSASNFMNTFRRTFGITCGDYRKLTQKNNLVT